MYCSFENSVIRLALENTDSAKLPGTTSAEMKMFVSKTTLIILDIFRGLFQ